MPDGSTCPSGEDCIAIMARPKGNPRSNQSACIEADERLSDYEKPIPCCRLSLYHPAEPIAI